MSQTANNISIPPPVGSLPIQNNDNWSELLKNLTVFISASTNLVQSLKQTIETSKSQSSGIVSEEQLCACTKLSQSSYKNSSRNETTGSLPNTSISEQKNASGVDEAVVSEPNVSVNKDLPVPETAITTQEDETEVSTVNQSVEPQEAPESESELKKSALEPTAGLEESTEESTLNESKADCSCKAGLSVSKDSVKDTKSKISTRSKLSEKQLSENLVKEKNEKLSKLKEDVTVVQTNLANIQEQIRQLERLYQDYDSLNTPEGQVNTAALYKEIMKPQSVPYVNTNVSRALPLSKVSQSRCTTCTPSRESTFGNAEVTFKNQSFAKKPQGNISYLSTAPLNRSFY